MQRIATWKCKSEGMCTILCFFLFSLQWAHYFMAFSVVIDVSTERSECRHFCHEVVWGRLLMADWRKGKSEKCSEFIAKSFIFTNILSIEHWWNGCMCVCVCVWAECVCAIYWHSKWRNQSECERVYVCMGARGVEWGAQRRRIRTEKSKKGIQEKRSTR